MLKYEVLFTVGFLQAKQRPRFNSESKTTYTPYKTRHAEDKIAIAYKGASIRRYGRVVFAPKGVPVAMRVDCYTQAPKAWPKWLPNWLKPYMPFTKKPDWDNLGKTATDALNSVAYHDDSQVTEAHVYKHDMDPDGYDHMDVAVLFYLPEQLDI